MFCYTWYKSFGARELEDGRRKKARPNPCAAAEHSGQIKKRYNTAKIITVLEMAPRLRCRKRMHIARDLSSDFDLVSSLLALYSTRKVAQMTTEMIEYYHFT